MQERVQFFNLTVSGDGWRNLEHRGRGSPHAAKGKLMTSRCKCSLRSGTRSLRGSPPLTGTFSVKSEMLGSKRIRQEVEGSEVSAM